jgi:hypothetical protein
MAIEIHGFEGDPREWESIIDGSPHGTIFHSWNWLKIIERHTGTHLYPLVGMKDGECVGVYPLFFQKKGLFNMVYSPPPRTALFYLGPVLANSDTLKQDKRETIYIEFQNSIDEFINNQLKADYILISLSPNLLDPRPFTWSGYTVEPHYDYVADLTCGADSLFQNLDKKQRQNLNRAKKRGITVELGGKTEFDTLLDLMDIRYAQQAKIVTAARGYFSDLYDIYKNELKIFVAKVEGEIVTGSIDFHYKKIHYSWIGSPKPKVPISPSPNDLVMWESVQYAIGQGCTSYVTMSAAGNKRLHSYYAAKFNPELKIRFSAKKTTMIAGILEHGYTDVIKPLKGKTRQLLKR